ncbi:hypothetical protein TWF696_005207 [Orbilia brochopaga]|uniref:VPS9 domain-containing protein n=1 Tax=Orbilia brochopaga TaxID=3140254 RepID=A0AAV9V050_9PEZI
MASSHPQKTPEAESQASMPGSQQSGLSRSFTRLDSLSSVNPTIRSRSSTLSSTIGPRQPALSDLEYSDASCHSSNDDPALLSKEHLPSTDAQNIPDDAPIPAELPAEILGMTDSFIESLSAKVHPAPVSVGSLSYIFQEFYDLVAASIFDHVSRLYFPQDAQGSDQPLVPMSEILQRKRNRKRREVHCAVLQELVEKRATEAVFDKIWRHSSSEDEARDEALRSKTMALTLVGIGLKELGLQDNINAVDLLPICEAMKDLNTVKCPNDKLSLLKKAHKRIVDILTALAPSTTSSADHILPILIYSLIISPPDINVISNLLYIQRFRYHKLVDGEDAYCLTNLEAAISFLETVDMGALTSNEAFSRSERSRESDVRTSHSISDRAGNGPRKPSISAPAPITATSVNAAAQLSSTTQKDHIGASSSISGPAKRISYLTPVEFAASAATSAVNTADQSLKTIGNSLENSYKFLFGRLSDKRTDLPKTLEDVRQLVGTSTPESESPRGSIMEDRLQPTRAKAGDPPESDIPTTALQYVGGEGGNGRDHDASGPVSSPPNNSAMTSQDVADPQQSSGGLAYTPVADSVRNL